MKKTTFKAILFVVVLFVAQRAQTQGILYLSNLGSSSFGLGAGSDGWLAQGIETGTDSDGYVLDSVQLEMMAATGNPSGFSVSIYSSVNSYPSADLGVLTGSSNPSSAGLYTYTASSLTLAPSTEYFIVVTDATPASQGVYNWAAANSSYSSLDQWNVQGLAFSSDGGQEWTGERGLTQTAIYATAIPEPSTWILCLLGGGLAFYAHVRKRAASQAKLN